MTTTLFPQRAAQYFLTLPTSGFFFKHKQQLYMLYF